MEEETILEFPNENPISNPNTFWSYLKSISITSWVLFFFILAILGLNVFIFLANETNVIHSYVSPILQKFGSLFKNTFTNIIDVTATGGKTVVNTTANTIDKGLTNIQTISKDESTSQIQMNKKAGYCLIGEDRGYRSCIYVDESTPCMSGDIFPSKDICIHPNLRQ
jgi:hypothetical protein